MGKNILYKTLETQETNGERRKRQMPQAKKFLHNPENNQQNEKTNYRVSDNIGTVIYIYLTERLVSRLQQSSNISTAKKKKSSSQIENQV